MNKFEIIEKLVGKGYDLIELSIVYYDAIINKRMKESEITEEYLISNLSRVSDIKLKVGRKYLDEHREQQLDFISKSEGILYVYKLSSNKKRAFAINEDQRVVIVDYESLIPLIFKSKLYKDVVESPISRFISKNHTKTRREVYDHLRIYGASDYSLDKYNIIENPCFKSYESEKEQEESEYISINGNFNRKQIAYLVERAKGDTALLEMIGIIPNPKSNASKVKKILKDKKAVSVKSFGANS